MVFTVHVPENCLAERRYIVALILEEFLGIPARIVVEPRNDVAIADADGKTLLLADAFLQTAEKHWMRSESLPTVPIRWVRLPNDVAAGALVDRQLPLLFGGRDDEPLVRRESPDRLRCSLDIFGTAFYMLSRYEEIAAPVADDHGRFPAQASLAHREGFLDRPIVDEYVELLWWLLSQQWPGLHRKPHRYQLYLSHDVDSPFRFLGRDPFQAALSFGADIRSRRGISGVAKQLSNALRVYRGNDAADPYNTFSLIMSSSEQQSVRSAFYFITRRRRGRLDGTYYFNSEPIQRLLRSIHDRGHEIGLHPGYSTFCSPQSVSDEFAILREQCDRLGIEQTTWGGRQHYLRWRNPTTWAAWESAGLDYDSSVGYSHNVGFRCGTCREYPVYDLVHRRPLGLRERPLIVMECALSYKLPQPAAACFERVASLVDRCRRLNGNFTLLWHNVNLATEFQRRCYEEILKVAA